MATRQELFTAVGLIRKTCRMNGHANSLILNLQGLGDYSDPAISDGLTPFERQKQVSEEGCNIILNLSVQLDAFVGKVNSVFLDSGLNAIPGAITRTNLTTDIQTSKTLSTDAKPLIQSATKDQDLSDLNSSFESYIPESGEAEPNPWALFSKETNHLNILHDILDAMSYELQGFNNNTGKLHGYGSQQLEKLMNNRTFSADVYLSHLPDSVDKQQMATINQYVKQNFSKINNIVLGQYIDSNITKQIIVRREWAL